MTQTEILDILTISRLSHQTLSLQKEEQIISTLTQAAKVIANPKSPIGKQARKQLVQSTGFSESMIERTLQLELSKINSSILEQVYFKQRQATNMTRRKKNPEVQVTCIILAGNVFTAFLRPLCFALLNKQAVILKTSSKEQCFPHLFKEAVSQVNSKMEQAIGVVNFKGGNEAIEEILFNQVDKVEAFGNDQTLAQIKNKISKTCTWVPHGHGLGVIFVAKEIFRHASNLKNQIEKLAFDICAFDQQGCLSPHVIFVEQNSQIEGGELAKMLSEMGMKKMAEEIPRGTIPFEKQSEIVQWIGIAHAQGKAFVENQSVVSWEESSPLRPSPGFRHIQMLSCKSVDDFISKIQPLGIHLKSIGVGGSKETIQRLKTSLPQTTNPRVCEIGQMQMHSYLEPWDDEKTGTQTTVTAVNEMMEVSGGGKKATPPTRTSADVDFATSSDVLRT